MSCSPVSAAFATPRRARVARRRADAEPALRDALAPHLPARRRNEEVQGSGGSEVERARSAYRRGAVVFLANSQDRHPICTAVCRENRCSHYFDAVNRLGGRYWVLRSPGHRIGECLELAPLDVYPGELDPLDTAIDVACVQQVMIERVEASRRCRTPGP